MARHHVCPACGYAYEPEKGESRAGVAPGTAFEQACSSFRCPVCNCPGQRFTEVEAVAAAVTGPTGPTGATGGGRYICLKCGYAYDPAKGDPDRGVAAGTAFVDLPEDWRCPTCKAPRDRFSPEA